MDHTDVLDRLATAFSERGKMASLEADSSAEGQELRRHLDRCEACRSELEAWRLTSLALAAATPESLRAPAEARDRILATVAATGVARGVTVPAVDAPVGSARSGSFRPRLTALPGGAGQADDAEHPDLARPADEARPRRLRPVAAAADRLPFRLVAIAAAVAVLLFVGGALLGPRVGLTQEAPNPGDLVRVVTALNGIVQQPDHLAVTLHTADGKPGGSVLVDPASGNLAVVTEALVPVSSQTYDCFVVRGAAKTKIGLMHFSDQTSYWVGKVASLSNPGQPGDTFEVWLGGTAGVLSLSGSF